MTPTARSLDLLRTLGYVAQVVEKFNSHVGPHGIRVDLFGCVDIEALAEDHTLYVQATPAARFSDHAAKCLAEPRLAKLLACPARRFEIWSWRIGGPRGKRKTWRCTRHRAQVNGGEIAFTALSDGVERR